MKIDPAKWQDEDWDIEDDILGKKLTHREKIYNDEKKASIQKKRKEKMRLREEEERLSYKPNVREYEVEDNDYYDDYPAEYDTWEEELNQLEVRRLSALFLCLYNGRSVETTSSVSVAPISRAREN